MFVTAHRRDRTHVLWPLYYYGFVLCIYYSSPTPSGFHSTEIENSECTLLVQSISIKLCHPFIVPNQLMTNKTSTLRHMSEPPLPLVVSTSRSFPHSWLITGFVTRVKRRVPLVEQELLTLPEYLSSSQVLSGVRVVRSLVFCVVFCRSLFIILAIGLSALLRFTDSDYPFKHFLNILLTLLYTNQIWLGDYSLFVFISNDLSPIPIGRKSVDVCRHRSSQERGLVGHSVTSARI